MYINFYSCKAIKGIIKTISKYVSVQISELSVSKGLRQPRASDADTPLSNFWQGRSVRRNTGSEG